MRVITVVGARPQFIKAAMVSPILRRRNNEILVHTGQHYDYNMSDKFFEELEIPRPDYNLGVAGGSHAQMTGQMMIALEEVMLKEKPDSVLIYGDTNSTLAAALVAAKLHIPICHVEAGVRTHSSTNPEEINRICTDHISKLLLASTPSGLENICTEGLGDRGIMVGDLMYDAFLKYSGKARMPELTLINGKKGKVPENYYYLTCHREENTNNDNNLLEIFRAMEQLDKPTVYPVHPRNKVRVGRLDGEYHFKNMIFAEPVGYFESIYLLNGAEKVVTDSGGLQREAFFARKKCVTILDFVCWPETMANGRNELSAPNAGEILRKLNHKQTVDEAYRPFGDGSAGEKIVEALEQIV